jgi:hypothetical protein
MNGGNFNVGFGLTAVGTYTMSGGTLIENSGAIFAVGNRGLGTVNQSGGSIYVRGASAVGTSVVQLGRNAATTGNGFGSGRYDLSGGILATAFIRYGQVVSGAGVIDTNTFNLRGAGRLITGTIEIFNTAATNSFNFTAAFSPQTRSAFPLPTMVGFSVLGPLTSWRTPWTLARSLSTRSELQPLTTPTLTTRDRLAALPSTLILAATISSTLVPAHRLWPRALLERST